ncbi:EF-hand domain-containing protein [Ideonella sp. YS5]|uniref:EF-hand domain-containing protein n=1 Tax=Ideonella sp. YS5 TaxID=3453714 RepID=UPI003EEE1258
MRRLLQAFCLAMTAGLFAAPALAQAVLRDPAIPESLRHVTPSAETRGEALQAQVQAKLRARFEAADTTGAGDISRAQAEAAGLGYVARHFDEIDASRHGSVSWTQVQAWLAQRQRSR